MFEQSEGDTFLAEQTTLPTSALDNQSRFVLQTVPRNRNSVSCNVNPNLNNNNNQSVRQRGQQRSDSSIPNSPNGIRSSSERSITKLPRGMSTTVL